jgi:hypothetical protein
MTVAEEPKVPRSGMKVWPLSVKAYHALADLGLIPEKAELLYGEVWLVLAPERQIEIFRAPTGDQFAEHTIQGPGGTATSRAVPGLAVGLDALFAES